MGRDPAHFPDPLSFKPERFLDVSENGGVEIGTGNLPFQFGPRRCLGERMAVLEVVSVLVKLVCQYDFAQVSQKLQFQPSIVLYAANGVRVIPRLRKDV